MIKTAVSTERVIALIPVRTAASRLPRKPLLDVSGKTALARVAARALAAKQVQAVVVATTLEASDDELVKHATELGLGVFRGSTEDVLARLTQAANTFSADIVVEVDGDDLLCASEYMDLGVDYLRSRDADWVSFGGLPLGATPNVLRTSALNRACDIKSYSDTQTGFFRFLTDSGAFRIEKPNVDRAEHRHETVRMTLDYPQDLAFFRAVYAELDELERREQRAYLFSDLVTLLARRPELVVINGDLSAAYEEHFRAGQAHLPANSPSRGV